MTESRQVVTLLLLTFVVGISGLAAVNSLPFLLEGDVAVDEYVATLYANGTLVEDYVYDVKVSGQYRMLYRSWDASMSKGELNRPYVQFLEARQFSEDAVVYMKDFQGSVWIEDRFKSNPQIFGSVSSLASLNEVGVFKPERFPAGRYKIRYVFLIHPPLEYDEDLCHLNLQLANKHLTYRNVRIIIQEADLSSAIYLRPPALRESRDGSIAVFYGSAAKDEPLEVEILFKKEILSVLNGYPVEVDNVRGLTLQANILFLAQYNGARVLREGATVLALFTPLIIAMLYLAFGREKKFAVPKYLSTIPNKDRKPWIVNLVFKGDAFDFDENGFYATVLDLHRSGKIRISSERNGDALTIQILDEASEDVYERRALQFLREISRNGSVDTGSIKQFAEGLASHDTYRSRLSHLRQEMSYLMRIGETKIASQFMISGRKRILPVALISAVLLAISIFALVILPSLSSILTASVAMSTISVIQSLVAVAFPSTLFGKWLGLSYREKLEWESFKRFLSDLALIRKYAPEDLSMWGEWLVYGTALGVGDAVVKAMRELRIQLPELNFAPHIPLLFTPMVAVGLPSGRGGGIGGGGGGFGSGGGFGGGGAGTR